MRPARLERATFCFVGKRSIQLSYGRKMISCNRLIIANALKQCQRNVFLKMLCARDA